MGKKKLSVAAMTINQTSFAEKSSEDLGKTVEQNMLERANNLEKEAAKIRTAIFALPESARALTRQQARKIGFWF